MRRLLFVLVCTVLALARPVTVDAQVTANFSSNITSGCAPILVQFTDQSTGNPTTWLWNLGNGAFSSLQNPSTTYFTPGTYTITLTVSDASGSNTKTVTNYITVVPTPSVSFTASDSGLTCPPINVQFTNGSVPGSAGAATYLWDFGDGTFSSAQNPLHSYPGIGNYSVTLSVTNTAGCSNNITKQNYLQLVPKPVAGFTVPNATACTVPASFSFTNTSTNSVSYLWLFGDNGTSTAANPSHSYTAAGIYTVKLVATNSAGCSDTFTMPSAISITPAIATFTKSASVACTNNAINFTSTSTTASGYTWYFGDGARATGATASHGYAAAGSYTVKLVVTNNGCIDSTSQTVTISQGPAVQFSATPVAGCATPLTTQFTNTTTGAASYKWYFGDGQTSTAANPSHTYTSFGSYNVKLVAYGTGGCNDSLTIPNYININPPTMTVSYTNTNLCGAPATVAFTTGTNSPLPINSYTWDFGDGTIVSGANTATHTYASTGAYTVIVTYNTGPGCTFTSTPLTVNIGSQPAANFSFTPANPCPNQNVTFTNLSTGPTGTIYSWYFGDGGTSAQVNPVHAYSSQGTYTITLVANNYGCRDTFILPITVSPPTAQFTPVYSCANRLSVSFNNTSVGGTTYLWNFGDGNTSTAQAPTHTYTNFGTYNVTLTVTNQPSGCTSTQIVPVILFNLKSQFTAVDSNTCAGKAVTFTANSSSFYNSYIWTFGSTTQTTTTNTVTKTFTTPGTYTVSLVVKDIRNCYDTLVKPNYITVNSKPTANFVAVPTSGCAPLTVNFSDLSTAGNGAISNWTWRFGDGGSSSSASSTASHVYASGTYSATLKVTDINGCTDSLVKSNYITANKPTASFYSADTNKCVGQTISFVNTTAGTGLTYDWFFGDGGSSTAFNPTHSYSAPGNYTVMLVVTNASSCKDTLTRNAYIRIGNMNINFATADTFANCPPLAVTLTNNSTNAGNYSWSFGNGNTSSVTSPQTIFTYPGTYTIKLKGQNSAGCIDSFSRNITVLGPTGTLSYSPTSGCSPLTVQFSSVNNNTQLLIWDMNNGVTQNTTASNTSYTYTAAGQYVPKLILSDGISCLVPVVGADTVKVDSVHSDFSFTPNSVCNSGTIQFYDSTDFSIFPVTTRQWTFGDGGTSAIHNPTHLYTAPGSYTVTLITGSSQGCNDTIVKTVNVLTAPVVSSGNDVSLCEGSNAVQLQATGATTYSWTPATGLSCTTCDNPTAQPAVTTTYSVIGTAANGCTDTSQVTVSVHTKPVIDAGVNRTICAGDTVQLNVTGATTYAWIPSTDLSCSSCANPVANPAAGTTYMIIGTDTNGCIDSTTLAIAVNPLPTVAVATPQPVCSGDSVQLQATGANSYAWTPSTTLSCSNCADPFSHASTTTSYVVTGTDANGCKDTAQVAVQINPLPPVSAGTNQSVCATDSVQLNASGAQNYIWTPAAGLSCTTCAAPKASPAATTVYTLSGTDANGCSNTAQVTVFVNAGLVISATNRAICFGDTAQLLVTGASNYTWSPATGLSCTSCANPIANPTTNTTYTIVAVDANGCTGTTTVDVAINALPTVGATAPQPICTGDSVQLQANGASTYVWTPSSTLSCANCADPFSHTTANTTYTITGTDANGCKDTAQVSVQVNVLPVVSAGSNQSVCAGDSVQLNASGAQSYAWSALPGLGCTSCSSPKASPSATTIYSVTGADANGCSNTAQVTVSVNALPVISGLNRTICYGDTAQLSVSGAVNYTWSPATGLSCAGCANPIANPTANTTYTVVGTDANGCIDTTTVAVAINALPAVTTNSVQAICNGDSVQLQANGANSYSWSPSATLSCAGCANPISHATSGTTYTVTGTDINGCKDTAQVTVSVNALPVVSANGPLNVCAGDSVQLNATGAQTYSWSPVSGLSCLNCQGPKAGPSASTSYIVTGTDANGCFDTAAVSVNVNALPVVTAGPNATVCSGSSVQLSAGGAQTYSWSPSTALSCTNCANPVATPLATTTYTVTGTNAAGCVDTQTVTITVSNNPVVTITSSATAICAGDTVQLQVVGASNYTWSPSSTLSCATCSNPAATPSSTTTYTVIGTAGNNCIDTAQFTLTVNPVPALNVSSNVSICTGQSTQLQASGAATYSWSPSGSLSCANCASPIAQPTATTTYQVIGATGIGCTAKGLVTVTVDTLPVVTAGADVTVCEGTAATLQAIGATNYQWTPSASLSCNGCSNPAASPVTTTTYTVIGTDAHGCKDTSAVTVSVNPKPVVTASGDVATCRFDTVMLNVTGAATYSWSPSGSLSCATCDAPAAFPSATTVYQVTGTDTLGCSNMASVTVTIYQSPAIKAGPDQTICKGQTVQLEATGGDAYTWVPGSFLSCANCSNPTSRPDTSISYKVIGADIHGCRDSDVVNITVIQPQPYTVGDNDTICSGESAQLSATGGDSYLWVPAAGLDNNNIANPVATPGNTTEYMVIISQGNCFKDTAKVTVSVNPLPFVDAGPDKTMIAGNIVNLVLDTRDVATYHWSPATDLNCTDCPAPVASPKNTTRYTVEVESEFGCKAKDDITIFVTCDNSQIFMANTFTPNGDGNNDRYYPQGKGITSIKRFTIFNRWGGIVYDVQDIPANDYLYGWDGTYKNDFVKPDVFIYILEAVCDNGQPIQFKGDVSLIR